MHTFPVLTHFRPMFHLTDKPGNWFLPAKSLKIPVEENAGHRPASLLKVSLFQRCFSNTLLVKTNYLVSK